MLRPPRCASRDAVVRPARLPEATGTRKGSLRPFAASSPTSTTAAEARLAVRARERAPGRAQFCHFRNDVAPPAMLSEPDGMPRFPLRPCPSTAVHVAMIISLPSADIGSVSNDNCVF